MSCLAELGIMGAGAWLDMMVVGSGGTKSGACMALGADSGPKACMLFMELVMA